MLSRNGTSPKQTGRNLEPHAIKLCLFLHIAELRLLPLFETIGREAALKAVPQSKKSLKIAVPWWNKQCNVAVKRKHAFNRMKRTWLLSDIIIFKRCRANARRAILEAKVVLLATILHIAHIQH